MDCHMPIMDGFEATVAIRKLQAHSDTYTPIIALQPWPCQATANAA